ncbi:glutathione S-transferase 1-like [Episyrphus balteatus]|uniref:glutathione S-transferase 1-like n=1 Tax=Episyrphus balteatus TaxID=286459 RepID=UPI0024850CC8|nr:glutathione S-transferase 1-like [Episyrphus balteatus]
MIKPALYYATLSPPSRAVMLTAAAIGIELEFRPIDLQKEEHLTPEFLKMNPQHTIPTLDDNGVIIYDSHAICAYLVGKYGKEDNLYPKDLAKRANVDARLHFDSGHLFARGRMLYEPILYHGSTDCSIEKIAYVQQCWDIMESFLKETPYLCGDELTIADLCCITTVTTINDVVVIDETKYTKLMAWIERMSELPYFKGINDDGAAEVKKLFREKLAENRSKN